MTDSSGSSAGFDDIPPSALTASHLATDHDVAARIARGHNLLRREIGDRTGVLQARHGAHRMERCNRDSARQAIRRAAGSRAPTRASPSRSSSASRGRRRRGAGRPVAPATPPSGRVARAAPAHDPRASSSPPRSSDERRRAAPRDPWLGRGARDHRVRRSPQPSSAPSRAPPGTCRSSIEDQPGERRSLVSRRRRDVAVERDRRRRARTPRR